MNYEMKKGRPGQSGFPARRWVLWAGVGVTSVALAFLTQADTAAALVELAPHAVAEAPAALQPEATDFVLELLGKFPRLTAACVVIGALRVPMKLAFTWLDHRAAGDGENTAVDRIVASPVYGLVHFLVDALASVKLDRLTRPTATTAALVVALGLSLFGTGCTSYRHERFTDAGQPIERTTLSAPFLTKTTLQDLKTRVSEKRGTNTYTRTLGVESAENKTDSEGVAALESLLGRLLVDGLKAAAPVPVK